jgi:hypothetical protein
MSINTPTTEFESVRTESNTVPVEFVPSSEINSNVENDLSKTVSTVPAVEISKEVEPEIHQKPEMVISSPKFSIGFQYPQELDLNDVRVIANTEKLNNKELPLAV